MASTTVTPAATPDLVPTVDRNGHPCPIAAARARFKEPIDEARASWRKEQYWLVHGIAKGLVDQTDRENELSTALSVARDKLAEGGEPESACAVLEMALAYDLALSNDRFRLAGDIMLALEDSDEEASHA